MNNFDFIRADLPNTFDYSKRQIINNRHELSLPAVPKVTHPMDELRVRNFVTNAPLPRQIPEVDLVEEERRRLYGEKVDIDPTKVGQDLSTMVLKLPRVDNDGNPIKDETGRMIYRYYTFKEMLQIPFLRQYRMAQLDPEAKVQEEKKIEVLLDQHLADSVQAALQLAHAAATTERMNHMRGALAEHPNMMVDLSNFNHYDAENSTLLMYAMNYVTPAAGRAGLDRNQTYLALMNFLIRKYGADQFPFSRALEAFKASNIANWQADRNTIAERMVMYRNRNAYERLLQRVRTGQAMFTVDQLIDPKTEELANVWSMVWQQDSDRPFYMVQSAFQTFLVSRFGGTQFDLWQAMQRFNNKGVDYWYQQYLQEQQTGRHIEAID